MISRDPAVVMVWLEGDEDEGTISKFKPFWFDRNKIHGFYIPDETEHLYDDVVNIYFDGSVLTVKSEPSLQKYLEERFVSPAK